MSFYEDLVMHTQMNYSKYYHVYASGGTPYQLADKKALPLGNGSKTFWMSITGKKWWCWSWASVGAINSSRLH